MTAHVYNIVFTILVTLAKTNIPKNYEQFYILKCLLEKVIQLNCFLLVFTFYYAFETE